LVWSSSFSNRILENWFKMQQFQYSWLH
jgi:hypothetical protein